MSLDDRREVIANLRGDWKSVHGIVQDEFFSFLANRADLKRFTLEGLVLYLLAKLAADVRIQGGGYEVPSLLRDGRSEGRSVT